MEAGTVSIHFIMMIVVVEMMWSVHYVC